jgi:hypothetical protein
LTIALAGTAAQTTVHLLNAAFLDEQQLNANFEGNAFAWASTVATFTVAFLAFICATALTSARYPFIALGVLTAFLSMDDMVVIHERTGVVVSDALGLPVVFDSVLWPAVYLPILAAVFALLLVVSRPAPPRARGFFALGLALLGSALAAEIASFRWSTGDGTLHVLEGAVEEAAELSGWIVIAAAMTVLTARILRTGTGSELSRA